MRRSTLMPSVAVRMSFTKNAAVNSAMRRKTGSVENAKVDGVITDHIMPGVSGDVFVRELRKVSPNIPVLVITGAPEVEDEYAGLGVMFRNKPLPPPELIHAVTELTKK